MGGCGTRFSSVVELDVGRGDVTQPAQSFEADEPAVADHNQPLEATGRAVEAARLTVASDAVVYDEVATVDVDL